MNWPFDPNPPAERDPSFSTKPRHDGPELREFDQKRIGSLQQRVHGFMASGEWRTLREIADACQGSEASVSARLRDFRKPEFAAAFTRGAQEASA